MDSSILYTTELAIGLGGLGVIHLLRLFAQFKGEKLVEQSIFALGLIGFSLSSFLLVFLDQGPKSAFVGLPLFFLAYPMGDLLMRLLIHYHPRQAAKRKALKCKAGLVSGLLAFSVANLSSIYLSEVFIVVCVALMSFCIYRLFSDKLPSRFFVFILISLCLFVFSFITSNHLTFEHAQIIGLIFYCFAFALTLRWVSYLLEFMNNKAVNS